MLNGWQPVKDEHLVVLPTKLLGSVENLFKLKCVFFKRWSDKKISKEFLALEVDFSSRWVYS
jgi:hypothetical protein